MTLEIKEITTKLVFCEDNNEKKEILFEGEGKLKSAVAEL